jgi:chromatin segregation and condensation protein Rec8/ScpA/Scc1 (kleisin family)
VALLDMAYGGMLKVRQQTCFGEIEIIPESEKELCKTTTE